MVNIHGVNDPSMLNAVGEKLQTEFNPVGISGGFHTHKNKPKSAKPWFESN